MAAQKKTVPERRIVRRRIAVKVQHIGVVKKSLDKIAALFSVLMGFKERGDFCTVVFQGVADTEQVRFFAVLMIIGMICA